MAWWEVNLTFLELVLLSVGGQGETEPMLAISTHTDTLKLLCLLWKKMNNHWLVWFISAYSWIHRTLRIKMPLEIVQSQPQLKAGSGWEGYRGRFPVEFWFNVKIPQPISQGNLVLCLTTLSVKMLFLKFKCNFLCFSWCQWSLHTGYHPAELGCSSPSPGILGDSCWLLIPERKIPSTDWKPNSLKINHFNIVAAELIGLTISHWIGWIHGNKIN